MEEILFEKPNFKEEEIYLLKPFFTNLDKSVYAIVFLPPEVAGALCSRASRAKEDLRVVFLKEFLKPFIEEKSEYGRSLKALIDFFHQNPLEIIFSNPRARDFYIKWLAEYGDDSIAQMSGTHLVYSSLSQIAIKHLENMRIGIAPIEKSTRYVDFSSKINDHYRYFTPPELKDLNLENDYQQAMDNLFLTYEELYKFYFNYLKEKYPEEKEIVLKTKVFDSIRRILPLSTLSQVSFFANGQAFEYMINRCLENELEEIRWAGKRAFEELKKIIPAFLRRIETDNSRDYRNYLSKRREKIIKTLKEINFPLEIESEENKVKILEFDPEGENKIIASLIWPETKESFEKVLNKIRKLKTVEKEKILDSILKERKFRWYKIPRAFENVYLRIEIMTNIGAWRDLQRHRMQTLLNQRFNIFNGYDLPQEIKEIGLEERYISAIKKAEEIFLKIYEKNEILAQYAVTFSHRIRFLQYQNLREFFWETELRSTSQGHPDYRRIVQEKAKLLEKIYPLIFKYLLIDFSDYEFARRESIKKIEEKEKNLKDYFSK
ncbi:MAG: hypothetical protein C4347_00790 [Patescibacteria group bacterium]